MKVTFVRPNMFDDRLTSAMQVLSFAILKGLTPPDVETVLYDERLERVPYDEQTDLVAMTVETFTARRAYKIADEYRRRGIPVVMGGFHPSMMPQEAALFADAVVIGDAEGVWPQIVEDARRGTLKPVYRSREFLPMAGLRVDRSIFAGKEYAPIALVQMGPRLPLQLQLLLDPRLLRLLRAPAPDPRGDRRNRAHRVEGVHVC